MLDNTYSSLRRAIVRTLSGEQLPRGLTSGRLFFGNASDGYTIAYTFRLNDRYARGGGRLYSFVALVHPSPGLGVMVVYRVIGRIWRRFEEMAEWLGGKVEKEKRRAEGDEMEGGATESTFAGGNVGGSGGAGGSEGGGGSYRGAGGSFLTSRNPAHLNNPWGIRMQGPTLRGRGLVEMTGDERVFAKVHMRFLECLQEVQS